jgi:hypothetical protein
MRSKQAAKEITDLNGSKRRQQLKCNNEPTTTTPNAGGENDCNRQYEQRQGDYTKTKSKS